MNPNTLLIINLVAIGVALCGIAYMIVKCCKAAKKLKNHGEKL